MTLLSVLVAGCGTPEAVPDPEAMAAFAESVRVHVEPGFTIRQDRVSPTLLREMDRLGVFAGEVSPDTSAVVLRRLGQNGNHVLFYRLGEVDAAWVRKRKRLRLDSLGGRWYEAQCHVRRRSAYPC
ncbi:MAG: hypothetical protein AAGJ11_18070 [Bacteroidota bacterium]